MTDRTSHPRPVRLAAKIWMQLGGLDRARLLLAIVLMAGSAAAEAVAPLLIGSLIDSVVARQGVDVSSLGFGIGAIFAALAGSQVLAVVRRQLVERVATAYERDSRTRSIAHAIRLPVAYFRARSIGAAYERIARGVDGSSRLLKLAFMDFLPAVFLAVAALIASFQAGLVVGAIAIAAVPAGLAIVRWQIRSQHGIRITIRDRKESIVGDVLGVLPSVDTIRAFGAEEFVTADLARGSVAVREAEMSHHGAMGRFDALKSIMEAAFQALVLLAAILVALSGTVEAGAVLAAYLLFQRVLSPLRELHRILDESAEASRQTADLFEFQAEPIDESLRDEVRA